MSTQQPSRDARRLKRRVGWLVSAAAPTLLIGAPVAARDRLQDGSEAFEVSRTGAAAAAAVQDGAPAAPTAPLLHLGPTSRVVRSAAVRAPEEVDPAAARTGWAPSSAGPAGGRGWPVLAATTGGLAQGPGHDAAHGADATATPAQAPATPHPPRDPGGGGRIAPPPAGAPSPSGAPASAMPQGHTGHGPMPGPAGTTTAPSAGSEPDAAMGPMQGGKPPPDARDPDAYSGGLEHRSLGGMEMADTERFGRLLFDKFEYGRMGSDRMQRLDGFAWYGGDYHKLFVKFDGERENNQLGAVRTEVLWDRVFATYWSTQLGVRHDLGPGPGRTWLAAGIQGLAPYWFDVEATLYAGQSGRTAFRGEVSYELLFTQRLILRSTVEAALYGRDDPERALGAGLAVLEAGLRLRYEIRRQFAPYIGIAWSQRYGRTADFARAAGERVRSTQLVVGVRLWF